ncbi:MAG: substrate-binding domain-containing protein [Cyanobacteriota bacterium]|nr:substrate-binding domain-containing protein [Cyanobacteriota bacterium]
MSQKNETLPLILALLITAAILGGGFWWFMRKGSDGGVAGGGNTVPTAPPPATQPPVEGSQPVSNASFPIPTSVPAGTTVRLNGSTSMVTINQALTNGFQQQFPGTTATAQAEGTEKGITAVLANNADIAAISRPLTAQEQSQGLVSVPVSQDAIAIVVGNENPLNTGLTSQQVVGIFTGQIASIPGKLDNIRVVNRPDISGTHKAFKELVLNGANFGSGPNFETLERDATTPLLQKLGNDGIGYATAAQVLNQQTVRLVPVDGLTPQAPNYPYQRALSYAYKQPASPQVEAFLGFVNSPQGQQAIAAAQQ